MKEKFSDTLVLAYRRCKNPRDIIGSNKFSNDKVVRLRNNHGESKPCIWRSDCQCCRQLKQTTTFSSKTTNKSFYIRHKLNCESRVIYLMDCPKVNRQRPTSAMQRPELKIPTLAKWLISPVVLLIIKICKKHLVLKTNSNINIYNET